MPSGGHLRDPAQSERPDTGRLSASRPILTSHIVLSILSQGPTQGHDR
ncbi:hypothetical protein HMPREF1129_2645 [Actinomyces naeslundii str. Howell 279]|uniref:Uncharacterized protein n=1 Tax=Actinomyces naeslundii (strain ATCC 12104 / DSM 43013 / CCUG 2238 / JCM 8349 / NCTC 10301 / Howell 279) TaxID=1115803 RepID=J3AA28_ACTNH|nr:hypothetical protein HMPREF1129_2645 [Actinomyces naeslundii str. Howell 279]